MLIPENFYVDNLSQLYLMLKTLLIENLSDIY